MKEKKNKNPRRIFKHQTGNESKPSSSNKKLEEKETEEKENEPTQPIQKETEEKKEPQNTSKQIYWVLGVMAGLILTFFIATGIMQSFKSFDYEGMKFTKDVFGNIPIYVYSYNAFMPITGNTVGSRQVTLILRGDPRKNNVPIDGGEIALPSGKLVYISINSTGLNCEYSTVAVASLSGFLTSNGFKVKGAVLDEQEAKDNNSTYVTCENNLGSPVIEIRSGEKTDIKASENCFKIEVANCEILPALEKFEVQLIADAKARAE